MSLEFSTNIIKKDLQQPSSPPPLSLPPIKIAIPSPKKDKFDETEKEDENYRTPKSEECILKPTLVCPPAPKKKRPEKRKTFSSRAYPEFYDVPEDLASLFIPLSAPTKKIRLITFN